MRTSFDFVWEYAVPPKRMWRHFTSDGVDHVWDALDSHGGGVFALAHYGSWDVAAACALDLGIPLTAVMTRVGDSDLATRIAAWARRHQNLEVLMTGGEAVVTAGSGTGGAADGTGGAAQQTRQEPPPRGAQQAQQGPPPRDTQQPQPDPPPRGV